MRRANVFQRLWSVSEMRQNTQEERIPRQDIRRRLHRKRSGHSQAIHKRVNIQNKNKRTQT